MKRILRLDNSIMVQDTKTEISYENLSTEEALRMFF